MTKKNDDNKEGIHGFLTNEGLTRLCKLITLSQEDKAKFSHYGCGKDDE